MADDAEKAARTATDAALGMAKTLGLTKPSLTDFAKNIQFGGNAVGKIAKGIEDQVGQYQVLTKSGVSFGGSITQMMTASTSAGLSIKEMTGLVASNSEILAGFGDTVQGGATKFLSNLTQMNAANNQYGTQLRNIGLTHEEIGEAMMATQRMAMMSGQKAAASDAQIQARTAEYAKDLDLLSKLTGKSNDALKKEQAALQRQGDFRAKTMGMEVDMQKAMTNAASEADASGIGDLFKDMMIRGFPGKDQQQLAGMFSNSMGVMKQMKAAQDAGQTAEYNRLKGTLAAAAIKDKEANKELAMLGGTNAATAAVAEAYAKTSDSMIAVQAQYSRGEIKLSQLQGAIQDRRIKAAEEQAKQGGNVEKGGGISKDAEQMVLQSALRGQEAMIRAASKVQADVTATIYKEYMGPLFKNLTEKAMSPDFNLIDPIADKAMKGLEAAKKFATTGVAPDVDPAVVEDSKNRINASVINGQNTEALQKLKGEIIALSGETNRSAEQTRQLVEAINKVRELTPGSKTEIKSNKSNTADPQGPGVGKEGNLPKRNKGTPGLGDALGGFKTFAASTENFGKQTLALLHGNELVMTKAQAAELDAGIMALTSSAHSTFANVMKTIQQPSNMTKSQIEGGREVAMLGNAGTEMSQANIQGAVNTLRSNTNSPAMLGGESDSMVQMKEAYTQSNTLLVEAIKQAMPADVFEKMNTAMERTASGIGSQLMEQKNMTKVTKNLGNMGNVFSRGGLNL